MAAGIPALLVLALAPSCRAPIAPAAGAAAGANPFGTTASIEPRAQLSGDILYAVLEAWSASAGQSTNEGEKGDRGDGGSDLSLEQFGGRITAGIQGLDLVAGAGRQAIGDDYVRELELGLRWRDTREASTMSYVESTLRRGLGYESPSGDVDYDGMRVGLGLLNRLGGHWFLDVGLGYEWTFDRLRLEAGEARERVSRFTLNLGLVYML